MPSPRAKKVDFIFSFSHPRSRLGYLVNILRKGFINSLRNKNLYYKFINFKKHFFIKKTLERGHLLFFYAFFNCLYAWKGFSRDKRNQCSARSRYMCEMIWNFVLFYFFCHLIPHTSWIKTDKLQHSKRSPIYLLCECCCVFRI